MTNHISSQFRGNGNHLVASGDRGIEAAATFLNYGMADVGWGPCCDDWIARACQTASPNRSVRLVDGNDCRWSFTMDFRYPDDPEDTRVMTVLNPGTHFSIFQSSDAIYPLVDASPIISTSQ